jgi:hypothetical protein
MWWKCMQNVLCQNMTFTIMLIRVHSQIRPIIYAILAQAVTKVA